MELISKKFFKLIAAVWVILWIIFMIRENKPGQHAGLQYLYSHPAYEDKVRYILGSDFYEFLLFCKDTAPAGATYRLYGLEKQDLKEIQARYFLWPMEMTDGEPDFKIYYPPREDDI